MSLLDHDATASDEPPDVALSPDPDHTKLSLPLFDKEHATIGYMETVLSPEKVDHTMEPKKTCYLPDNGVLVRWGTEPQCIPLTPL